MEYPAAAEAIGAVFDFVIKDDEDGDDDLNTDFDVVAVLDETKVELYSESGLD